MNLNRLEKLATFLHNYDGPIRCNLSVWNDGYHKRCGFLWLRKKFVNEEACAIGLTCIEGALREEGLVACSRALAGGFIIPQYQSARMWHAVKAFFGLNSAQAEACFMPRSYGHKPSFKDVAARIRKTIAEHRQRQRQHTIDKLLDPVDWPFVSENA